ncbi:hypothetical protein N7540_008759, partial [Penicillium herquei]
ETVETPAHPFYPPDINPVDYVANTLGVPFLLSFFALATAAIIIVTSFLLKWRQSTIPSRDKFLVGWFIFSKLMPHRRLYRMQDIGGQLWKEYAQADSRYMTMEPFVLCMETITAFAWGPLSYLTAWMIMANSPHRHPTQILVSMGQLYGDVLYYATSIMEDYYHERSYSRPEPYYYWGYFIFLNAFWIVIPAGK